MHPPKKIALIGQAKKFRISPLGNDKLIVNALFAVTLTRRVCMAAAVHLLCSFIYTLTTGHLKKSFKFIRTLEKIA
jgi:hypothetical protein